MSVIRWEKVDGQVCGYVNGNIVCNIKCARYNEHLFALWCRPNFPGVTDVEVQTEIVYDTLNGAKKRAEAKVQEWLETYGFVTKAELDAQKSKQEYSEECRHIVEATCIRQLTVIEEQRAEIDQLRKLNLELRHKLIDVNSEAGDLAWKIRRIQAVVGGDA